LPKITWTCSNEIQPNPTNFVIFWVNRTLSC
jgi:hypothetical protein